MTDFRALITGASRGLGRSIAAEFWNNGCHLAVVARPSAALDELAADLRSRGTQDLQIVPADLSDPEAPAAVIDHLRGRWDRLDALINNAAVSGPIGRLWENDWRQWQETLQVNLVAPVALCRLAIPLMPRGGSIVNLSGGGATGPRPNFSAYGTAKAALVRFTETLAQEVAEKGIRVNAISPGIMATRMLDDVARAGPEHAGDDYQRALDTRRSGGQPPERAAALAWFLASPASEGITGRLISAVWDPWPNLSAHVDELRESDIYTLRRITPENRGKQWT
ncbi:MAG TPA: SDR family oxidoreductase [Bryobacteraceae bacterium]|nr:SDR family oxidoreductase [Bryobacteraceae bacterium]